MKEHELKCWPAFFDDVASGKKTFEVRQNDRDYKVGDVLFLREFEPCRHCDGFGQVWDNGDHTGCNCMVSRNPKGIYTGACVRRTVTYILGDFNALREGYVVMSLAA